MHTLFVLRTLLIVLFMGASSMQAQRLGIDRLGDVQQVRLRADGVELQCTNALLRVQAITPQMAVIHLSTSGVFDTLSYAVAGERTVVPTFRVEQTATAVTLLLDSVAVEVSRKPASVTVRDRRGNVRSLR